MQFAFPFNGGRRYLFILGHRHKWPLDERLCNFRNVKPISAPNLMHLNSPLCIQLARTFDAVYLVVDTARYAM